MGRHEHIEEICAAASIGEASSAELAELDRHLRFCPDCKQVYSEFLHIGAVRVAGEAVTTPEISGEEAIAYIDSAQFRERFLERAKAKGILSTQPEYRFAIPDPVLHGRPSPAHSLRLPFVGVLAASVLLCVGIVAHYRGRLSAPKSSQISQPANQSPTMSVPAKSGDSGKSDNTERLTNEIRRLNSETAALKLQLVQLSASSEAWKVNASRAQDQLATLAADGKRREDQLEHENDEAQSQAAKIRMALDATQADVAADQLKIKDLTGQLAEESAAVGREREMLAADRDIRDLMSARNLHIADIFDTDGRGKTRSSFGRVFFTEGRSLIIYAYDLDDRRVQEAGYHYRVWGKKEGPGNGAKNLGIFYSDDKAQKRWVFKCEDRKVLSEIDSVFVTLEPPGKDISEPKGQKFLYAYLRNQPNHP